MIIIKHNLKPCHLIKNVTSSVLLPPCNEEDNNKRKIKERKEEEEEATISECSLILATRSYV